MNWYVLDPSIVAPLPLMVNVLTAEVLDPHAIGSSIVYVVLAVKSILPSSSAVPCCSISAMSLFMSA